MQVLYHSKKPYKLEISLKSDHKTGQKTMKSHRLCHDSDIFLAY